MRARLLVLALLAGCGEGPGAEELADLAAADSRWADAYESLRGAGDEPRILGKRAESALQAGQFSAAIQDWGRLARFDSTRRGEAAAGLVRSAVAAERVGDEANLEAAVIGLRAVAPDWPIGRLALSIRLASGAPSGKAFSLAPAILAGAPTRDVADAALYALARAEQDAHRCERAEPIFRTVNRRGDSAIVAHGRRALSDCRVRSGLIALDIGDTVAALEALNDAVDHDPNGPAGRRASIAIGDVRIQTGDLFGALISWQSVATALVNPDSITAMALDRLSGQMATDSTGVTEFP